MSVTVRPDGRNGSERNGRCEHVHGGTILGGLRGERADGGDVPPAPRAHGGEDREAPGGGFGPRYPGAEEGAPWYAVGPLDREHPAHVLSPCVPRDG